jgi:hypothetical protein
MNFNPATAQADARALKAKFFPKAPTLAQAPKRDVLRIVSVPESNPQYYTPDPVGARRLVAHIADKHGMGADDVFSKSRRKAVTAARYEAIGAVAKLCRQWSMPRMGRFFGLHHTTILYALNRLRLGLPPRESKPTYEAAKWLRIKADPQKHEERNRKKRLAAQALRARRRGEA